MLYDKPVTKKGRWSTMKMRMKKMIMICAVFTLLMAMFLYGAEAETAGVFYTAEEMFSERDLKQTADLSEAVTYTLSDGQDIRITSAGVYVLAGQAENVTVYVEAGKDDKVQLVLNGVTVANTNFPVIYIKTADKVFVTTGADSALSVTGAFVSDGSVKTDGVIFSKSDLVLNGTAALTITSTDNGVVCKDDLKITGGTYSISAASKAVEANDSIRIADGNLYLVAGTDGLHAENDDDGTKGYVFIASGTINVQAGDDGIHASSVVQIDGGTLTVKSAEGIEATYIQINGGVINIQSSDDGINAAQKSKAYTATVEINDGDITVVMGAGDTDGIDSNGNIIVNGGTISVTGNSTFDYDGNAQYNGGTIIANGQQISYIPNPMMVGRGNMNWGNMNEGWGNMNESWGNMNNGWGGRGNGRGGRGGW